MNNKTSIRCTCGAVTFGILNYDKCSKCDFVLLEAWGCHEVPSTSPAYRQQGPYSNR